MDRASVFKFKKCQFSSPKSVSVKLINDFFGKIHPAFHTFSGCAFSRHFSAISHNLKQYIFVERIRICVDDMFRQLAANYVGSVHFSSLTFERKSNLPRYHQHLLDYLQNTTKKRDVEQLNLNNNWKIYNDGKEKYRKSITLINLFLKIPLNIEKTTEQRKKQCNWQNYWWFRDT